MATGAATRRAAGAVSAFNAYFAVKYHDDADVRRRPPASAHERTEVRDEAGEAIEVDLWTGCYTPRELRLLLGRHGLAVDWISSVEPGRVRRRRHRRPSRRSSW